MSELLNQLRTILGIAEKDVTISDTAKALVSERDRLKAENKRLTESQNSIRRTALGLQTIIARIEAEVPKRNRSKKFKAAVEELRNESNAVTKHTYNYGGYAFDLASLADRYLGCGTLTGRLRSFDTETRPSLFGFPYGIASSETDEQRRARKLADFALVYGGKPGHSLARNIKTAVASAVKKGRTK